MEAREHILMDNDILLMSVYVYSIQICFVA